MATTSAPTHLAAPPGPDADAPSGRRRDYDETRSRILESAMALFAKGGPAVVTMSAVAARADVNRTTVHRHFATRDDLLWAVSDRLARQMGVELPAAMERDDLGDGIAAFVAHFMDHPDEARACLLQLISGETADGHPILEREVAMMQLLESSGFGRPGIDAEVLGVINLAGMLLWSVLAADGAVDPGRDRFARESLRLLLHGAIDPGRIDLVDGLDTSAPTDGL
jgi:AcrR family transcriptional regulator